MLEGERGWRSVRGKEGGGGVLEGERVVEEC